MDLESSRVGGTRGWHKHLARAGVSGLHCVWSEGVGIRKGVRQCGPVAAGGVVGGRQEGGGVRRGRECVVSDRKRSSGTTSLSCSLTPHPPYGPGNQAWLHSAHPQRVCFGELPELNSWLGTMGN